MSRKSMKKIDWNKNLSIKLLKLAVQSETVMYMYVCIHIAIQFLMDRSLMYQH